MMYGVWNSVDKRFCFGISEKSSAAAWAKFEKSYPALWRLWRYEIKRIPDGFKNPKNPNRERWRH